MKKVKIISLLTLSLCVSSFLYGCQSPLTSKEEQLKEIYQLALEHGFTGSYNDWISSLVGDKGEPGKDGYMPKVEVGHNGNWFIDDVDSGVSANGNDGASGKNGSTITSIEYVNSVGSVDIYQIVYSDGTSTSFKVTNGNDGQDGISGEQGIQGIEGEPGKDGKVPEILIGSNGNWFINNLDTGILAEGPKGPIGPAGKPGEPGKDGQDGVTIVSISYLKTEQNKDIYTILYSNGETSEIKITNGKDGLNGKPGIEGEPGKDGKVPEIYIGDNGNWIIDGVDTNVLAEGPEGPIGPIGPAGPQGKPGEDGVTIINIEKTSTEENVDTYTIFYSNGNKYTFTVSNGKQGIQGEPGQNGKVPEIKISEDGYWVIDGITTEHLARPNTNDKICEVYLQLDGGTLPEGQTNSLMVKRGEYVELPIPYKKGHNFLGWYYGYNNGEKKFTNYDPIVNDMTLCAHYKINTYKIKLDLDGGIYNGSTEFEVEYGEHILLKQPVKNGLYFDGWYLDDKPFNDSSYRYEKDITLVAKYSNNSNYPITTVDLDLNGGSYLGDTSLKVGRHNYFYLPNDVSKDGYTFDGWLENNKKVPRVQNLNISGGYKYVAQWKNEVTYNIELDLNGGYSDSITSYSFTSTEILNKKAKLPIPTKDGYEFVGYSLNNTLVTRNTNILSLYEIENLAKENKNITLTAKYKGIDNEHIGDYIELGECGQNQVEDIDICKEVLMNFSTLGKRNIDLNGEKYVVCFSETTGLEDVFKVEPILWEVKQDGLIVPSNIFELESFGPASESYGFNPNNYKESGIRDWINNQKHWSYLRLNFKTNELKKIKKRFVDNSLKSTGDQSNKYVCDNTEDYFSLLSYEEVTNKSYGYINSEDRIKLFTDLSAFRFFGYQFESYWLRTPGSQGNEYVKYVDRDGNISTTNGLSRAGIPRGVVFVAQLRKFKSK